MGGFLLENGVEFSVGAIGFVGDRAHNNERNVIQEARVSNSCAFHFAATRRKRADDALFFSIGAYELIARCNTAIEFSNISCNLRCRLLDMGIIPKTRVTLQKVAPMGDPIEIRVRGYELTLRVEEAEKIEVEVGVE